jgi:hypothetical protein
MALLTKNAASESASTLRLAPYKFKWLNIASDAAPTVLID